MRLKLAAYIASDDWRKKYDYVDEFYEGFAAVVLNGKWGFVNRKGEEVIPPKYDDVNDFYHGFARVQLNGKYGFVNTEGVEIVPPMYDDVWNFNDGFAPVELNRKYGFINTQGEEVVPPMYNEKEWTQLKALVDTGEYKGTLEKQYKEAHEEFQIWKKENKP